MGTVQAKEMTKVEPSKAEDYLNLPSVVDKVNIEGLHKTKTDFILPEISKILEAETFGEVVAITLEVRDNLNSLEIFKTVDVSIDTSHGPKASVNGYDVTFNVKEKRCISSNVGTQVGNNEGSMVFGAKANNVLGRGESLKADLGFGTRTKTSYQLGFTKPVAGDHDRSYFIGAQKSMTEVFQSSHKESTQGVNMTYGFPSRLGQHSVGWEGSWREVMGFAPNASFPVRQEAGHSLKSSLQHTVVADTRDHPSFPSEGSLFKLTQELAGLGGNVSFLKNTIEIQENIEVYDDIIFSWSAQAGLLNTLRSNPSRINDRFFLGGPQSVRGFQMKGIGPKEQGDSLGGEMYWAAGVHLYTPLPFRPCQGTFGNHVKTHLFFNAGNLIALDSALPWKQRAYPLVQNIRWSFGLGLVLMLGVARVELNYCIPQGLQPSDGLNPGLQVGVGINFL